MLLGKSLQELVALRAAALAVLAHLWLCKTLLFLQCLTPIAQGEGAPLRQFRFRFLDTPLSRNLADDGGILENQVCTCLAACFTCCSLPHVQPAFVYTLKLYHSHSTLPGEFVCSLLLCSRQAPLVFH